MSFQKMVTRLNPEMLPAGTVSYSQNGRMDNDLRWTPRKGTQLFKAAPSSAGVLVLPFSLDDNGTPPQLNDAAIDNTYGTIDYLDPFNHPTNGIVDWLVTVTNAGLSLTALDAWVLPADKLIAVESGENVSQEASPVVMDNSLFIFRPDQVPLRYDGSLTQSELWADSPTVVGDVATFTDTRASQGGAVCPHGLRKGSRVLIQNITGTGSWNTYHTVDSVPDPYTFTFIQAGLGTGTISTTSTIQKVLFPMQSGTYAPVAVDSGTLTVTDGVCNMYNVSHGRVTGETLTVYDDGGSEILLGDRYEITVVDDDNYKFNLEHPDGEWEIQLGGKQPLGGGFIHVPNAPWGIAHQGRLILPYAHSGDAIKDELIFSDIFDANTYDPILNTLRFGSGSGEEVIAARPLLDDRLLVLCRRSLHIVNGISGSLSDLSKWELTREVGCVSRKSVTEIGGTIVWLSDRGVYSATYGQEQNLIANSTPLSEPIEDLIRGINWEYASKSIGAYADNRYYLAVPYGTSTKLNRIFVYNFLNQGWESVDTVADDIDISDMVVVRYKGVERIFMVDEDGAVLLYEELVSIDELDEGKVVGVAAILKTRGYQFGDLNHKRFTRCSILKGDDGVMAITAEITDPNLTRTVIEISQGETTQNTRRRINERGRSIVLALYSNYATVKGCSVDAIISSFNDVTRG